MSDRLTLANAPLGTKAPAIGGGHWVKVARGWKWFNGDTFPTVGGDWDGTLIPPDASTSPPSDQSRGDHALAAAVSKEVCTHLKEVWGIHADAVAIRMCVLRALRAAGGAT